MLRQRSVRRNNPSQVLVCVLRGKPGRRRDLRSKVCVLAGDGEEGGRSTSRAYLKEMESSSLIENRDSSSLG